MPPFEIIPAWGFDPLSPGGRGGKVMTYKRTLMVKGPGVGSEGRGDIGVRFDTLNELKGGGGGGP